MGLRRYIHEKKVRKRILKEKEKRFSKMLEHNQKLFLEDIKKINMGELSNEEELPNDIRLEMEELKKFNRLFNNQVTNTKEMDDEKITKNTIIDIKRLDDMAYYKKIMDRIDKLIKRKKRLKFASIAASLLFLFWMFTSYSSQANPFQFLIQVAHFIDGKISVKQNVEYEENANLDFDVYQVGYMTEDYVLMDEVKLDNLYKTNYNKDPNHFITIDQAPIYDKKNLSQTDITNYQTILQDGMEYLYNYNFDSSISTLYFIKENTSIFIRGTIEKDEILHIANNLFKK